MPTQQPVVTPLCLNCRQPRLQVQQLAPKQGTLEHALLELNPLVFRNERGKHCLSCLRCAVRGAVPAFQPTTQLVVAVAVGAMASLLVPAGTQHSVSTPGAPQAHPQKAQQQDKHRAAGRGSAASARPAPAAADAAAGASEVSFA
jgi:hypothetical protein